MITSDPDNPPYLTVLTGIGVFQPVLMIYNKHSDEYFQGQVYKPRKTFEQAADDALTLARGLGVEIR